MTGQQQRKAIVTLTAIIIAVLAGLGVYLHNRSTKGKAASQAQAVTKVRFGMLPYGDHTYAIIGVKKGWFKEAGIDLEYRAVKVEDTVPFLLNGSLDIGSCSPGVIVAAHDSSPGVVNFVFGDIFQGYAIMAQPTKGFKSVGEFKAEGMDVNAAIRATAEQIRGHRFAYPSEAAIKPFIDLALAKGGLQRSDFQASVLDDPLTVNAMRSGQADFQVGGVPSRLVLQREGYKPILSSNDLASAARPSPDSEELASIFADGWASTTDYYRSNRDTILRLASVNFRIVKFMNEHMDEALALHMPYLSQVTGQQFSLAEGRIFYTSLDPFFTFEAQKPWYHDQQSPYYYENLNGAIINNFVRQHAFRKEPPRVSDVIIAHEVYYELERMKQGTEQALAQVEKLGKGNSPKVAELVARARSYYDAYNFLDSERMGQAAVEAAKH